MGFRFQRRINLGGGWGLNTSGSGGSLSYRSGRGSIGTKGFSLRTGIPGLSYRRNWGKDGSGAALIVLAFMLALAAIGILIKLLIYVLPLLWSCLKWLVMTLYDLCAYGIQRTRGLRPPGRTPRHSLFRETLAGIAVCGTICLIFFLRTSNAPSLTLPETASVSGPPKETSEPPASARSNVAHPRNLNPPSTPAYDDLARVRANNAAAADRIEAYCAGANEKTTSERGNTLARCRRDEMAAWMRLDLYNEFPSLSPTMRQKCASATPTHSFVAEESCIRDETNQKHAL
jgi:hypothetical protein